MEVEHHSQLLVAADPTSVGEARRFVRAALYDWDADVFEEAATLLVSEVVTNVVLHARTPAEVHVSLHGERFRVEVHDGNPLLPTAKHYGPESTTGRGIGLLETMSSAWGAEATRSGKRVWFELDAGAVVAAAAAREVTAPFFDEVDLDDLEAALGGDLREGVATEDVDEGGSLPAHDLGWRVLQGVRR